MMQVGSSIEANLPPLDDVVTSQPRVPQPTSNPPAASAPIPPTKEETQIQSSTNEATAKVTLSDDGRPIETSTVETLQCPMCPKTFAPGAIQDLQFHVEEHMKTNLVSDMKKGSNAG